MTTDLRVRAPGRDRRSLRCPVRGHALGARPGHTVLTGAGARPGAAARLDRAHPRARHRAGVRQPARKDRHERHPDTIVLIHGFWVTPRSWEHWKAHYEARATRVLAPAYPGFEVEVEALNADPTPIEEVTVPQIIEHLEARRRRARRAADPDGPLGRRRVHADPARPRLRRRRRGDQLGADRGRQASCRSRRSRRRSRCSRTPPTAIARSASRHEQWHYAFTNGVQRGGVPRALRALPHPRLRRDLLGQRARQHPPRQGRQPRRLLERRPRAAAVHLRQRGPPDAAEASSSPTPSTTSPTHRHRGQGVRRARTCCRPRPGWEEVADYALDWALEHAGSRAPRERRPPHPHRRADAADRGGRLAAPDRPDVRRPRPEVPLRLGRALAQARRARRSPAGRHRRRSTRSCSPTTTTTTTSTPPGARCCRRPGVVVTTVSGAAAARRARARPRAVADDGARGARPAGDRDHRHAVPPRAAALATRSSAT